MKEIITYDKSLKYIIYNFLQSIFAFKNVSVTFLESSAISANVILKLDSVSVNLA